MLPERKETQKTKIHENNKMDIYCPYDPFCGL